MNSETFYSFLNQRYMKILPLAFSQLVKERQCLEKFYYATQEHFLPGHHSCKVCLNSKQEMTK